jgi:pseudouridine-5'-phosphate glycosidase
MFLGMPYPQNLRTAKEVEGIVRENGAVPATIAILDGVPCVGIYHHLCLVCAFNYYFMIMLTLLLQ